jgi:release factor glutamine methyltransferase
MTASDSGLGDSRIEDFVAEFLAARNGRSTIYEPREDSFLMLDVLAELNLRGLRVLDMGTGSGILAAYCARRGADVTASDIDIEAIRTLELTAARLEVSIKLIACDLFSKIHGSFDIIVFNPPYLPSSTIEDRTIDGGEQGTQTVNRFLDKLTQHLIDNGLALLVVSSSNDPELLVARHPDLSFRKVRERSLFFEKLCVFEVKARKGAPTHR